MLSAAHFKSSSTTPGASSEPPPSPDSRSSRDGWRHERRHDRLPRVKVHRLRAYQPAHPVKLSKMARKRTQQRWSGLLTRIAKQVRATLGDAQWADFVAHANPCYNFRNPILHCVAPRATACPRNFLIDGTYTLPRARATWDDGVDGALLCRLLFSVHNDLAHGAAMLRFHCGPVHGQRGTNYCHKHNVPHYCATSRSTR